MRSLRVAERKWRFQHWQPLLYIPSKDDSQSQLSLWLDSSPQPINVQHSFLDIQHGEPNVLAVCVILLLYHLSYNYSVGPYGICVDMGAVTSRHFLSCSL